LIPIGKRAAYARAASLQWLGVTGISAPFHTRAEALGHPVALHSQRSLARGGSTGE